jgi:hypothetical protein|tara:strand:+ start:322 stop:663 length:342 start_codon:yes stop_codon:yes gene_type:complete
MTRANSPLFFLAGFTQLYIGSVLGDDATLALLGAILEITGGSSVLVGLYMLIFVARHHKQFSESYNKIENSVMSRENTGELHRVDPKPASTKLINVVIPSILAFIAAWAWLAN